jgi:uncharacterized repeat protein (TIGR04076 family)
LPQHPKETGRFTFEGPCDRIKKHFQKKGRKNMDNPAKVLLTIISVKGTCAAAHQAGQEFDLGSEFKVGISKDGKSLCPSAFYAAFPYWRTLRFGGEFPWEKDRDVTRVACPDPLNPVVMELRRVSESKDQL